MKKSIIIIALAAAATLTGCTSSKLASVSDARRAQASWNAFCAARGYDRNDNSAIALNNYLDTWCGSVDEETALIKAGIQPY